MNLYFEIGLFILGFILHSLKESSDAVQKHPSTYANKKAWLLINWANILVRCAISLAVWIAYTTDASLVVQLLGKIGISFGMALPVTKTTSFFFGYVADSLMDLLAAKVPWLNHYIPQEVDTHAPVATNN